MQGADHLWDLIVTPSPRGSHISRQTTVQLQYAWPLPSMLEVRGLKKWPPFPQPHVKLQVRTPLLGWDRVLQNTLFFFSIATAKQALGNFEIKD